MIGAVKTFDRGIFEPLAIAQALYIYRPVAFYHLLTGNFCSLRQIRISHPEPGNANSFRLKYAKGCVSLRGERFGQKHLRALTQ